MSVYQQPYATPSRILGVFNYLLHAKGQRAGRDELEEMLMPENLPLTENRAAAGGDDSEAEEEEGDAPKRDMVRRSIDEAVTMQLVIAEDNDLVLHPELPVISRTPSTAPTVVRQTLSALLLSPANLGNHDLARALAWYLGQDVHAAPSSWHDVDQRHRSEAHMLGMTNSKFGQLLHWSRFLRFAWAHAAPERAGQKSSKLALTPDPYWQIRWRLAGLFAEQRTRELPLAMIAADLARSVPVLEGGVFRSALEGNLLPVREPHQFSSATAHAWLRLHEEGIVRLAYRSDGASYLFPDGDAEATFTEVAWHGGEA